MPYIDTSVLAAYYCPEPRTGRVQRRLQACTERIISPLVELELHAAMAMKVRTGALDLAGANRIIATYQSHVAGSSYTFVPVSAAEYAQARDWLGDFTTALKAPDALHLALAFNHDLAILTSDEALARSAAALGVQCELLR